MRSGIELDRRAVAKERKGGRGDGAAAAWRSLLFLFLFFSFVLILAYDFCVWGK
jgi:hypothetical protein